MQSQNLLDRSELGRVLASFRREFWLMAFFSVVVNTLLLTPTLYMLQLYDRVMVSYSELTLLAVSFLTVFLLVWMALAEWGRSRLLIQAGLRLDHLLSARLFEASFLASLRALAVNPAGAFSDFTQIRQFLTGAGVLAFFDVPWTLIYLGVLFVLHPFLGGLALVFMALQAALAWWGQRRTVAPALAASQSLAEVNGYLQAKLRHAEVLQVLGMLPDLAAHWASRQTQYLGAHGQSQGLLHRIAAWSKLLRYAQQSLALGAGALLVIDGTLSVGGMIAANVLMTRALAPIDQLVGLWRVLSGVKAAYARLEALLMAHPPQPAQAGLTQTGGDLVLQQVTATAIGRERPILKGISLTVPQGSVVVVLGPSGSGKSTLARVLVGVWPDLVGQVLWGGLPLAERDRVAIGPEIGYLPQDVALFDGTIAENMARFGELQPDKVVEAATCTGLNDMILHLPKGYDTPVGEEGGALSGGQRQRIALARAVYGRPGLLVLDEPNANLDDLGELALAKTVQAFKAMGKTVVLVSHRPGVLALADQLVVLHNGTVSHQGPRDTVLAALRTAG
jgi:ATP-binding cassette, subfamily C, bacterial exporter for protease/lipase